MFITPLVRIARCPPLSDPGSLKISSLGGLGESVGFQQRGPDPLGAVNSEPLARAHTVVIQVRGDSLVHSQGTGPVTQKLNSQLPPCPRVGYLTLISLVKYPAV